MAARSNSTFTALLAVNVDLTSACRGFHEAGDTGRAMTQGNVEVVLAFFGANDVRTAFEALADDVTFAFHGESRRLAGAEEISGKDATVRWMVDWFSRFRDYRFEIDDTIDWGDRVLVVTTHEARGRSSGAPIRQRTAQVLTVRDGKIVRQDFFASREDALEAAGPSE
jgi:ketosteroid isomerase-like protein